MRRYIIFISLFCLQLTLVVLLVRLSSVQSKRSLLKHIPKAQMLTSQLELTDFSLWTEARYTRHLSQADRFSAFQDSPGSFDHFPAGIVAHP